MLARALRAPRYPQPPHEALSSKKRAAAMTIHSSFYASQLACLLVWSGLVRVMTGRHLHALCAGAVLTRPPWLSARWLLLLDKHRSSVFAALPVVLAVAAVWPSSWPVRLIAAVAVSLYHLLESSGTNRHGEYPLMYNALGMLLPADHAHAFALGVAIHFVLSSGVAKLQYGGRAWLEEGTMRASRGGRQWCSSRRRPRHPCGTPPTPAAADIPSSPILGCRQTARRIPRGPKPPHSPRSACFRRRRSERAPPA